METYDGVVGIDLGATYCSVGIWDKADNHFVALVDEEGNSRIPSEIHFLESGEYVAGSSRVGKVERIGPYNREQMVGSVHPVRLLGRTLSADSSITDQTRSSAGMIFVNSPNGRTMLQVGRSHERMQSHTAEQLLGFLLQELKGIAESYLGRKVERVVIAIPPCFDDAQRQSILDAGSITGLSVLRLVSSTLAATMALCVRGRVRTSDERIALVVEVGGGTTSVALVGIDDTIVEMKAMAGDTNLGGLDFTQRLMDHYWSRQRQEACSPPPESFPHHSAFSTANIRLAFDKAKRQLSTADEVSVDLSLRLSAVISSTRL
jgi:molecular chaperone DnaK (HSP70)